MLSRLRIHFAVFLVFIVQPAFAQQSSCPKGIELPNGAVKNVQDILRFKRLHSGQQVIIEGIDLKDADFSKQDVSDLCFRRAKLKGSKWSDGRGTNTQFHDVDLSGSDWTRFEGRALDFSSSDLSRASLAYSVFERTKFDWTDIEQINAPHANFSGSSFHGGSSASMKAANFRFSNMSGFEFRCGIGQDDNCGGDSSGVSLVGANLTGAALLMASKSDWDLTGAVIANTRLHFIQLDWVRASKIRGPVLIEPTMWTPARYDSWFGEAPPKSAYVSLSIPELEQVRIALGRLDEPGFDCEKAQSHAERYICGERDGGENGPSSFAYADRELNEAYVLARRKDRSIATSQRRWLRERDACIAIEEKWDRISCFNAAYRERIEKLWQIAGMSAGIASGEKRVYADEWTAGFIPEIDDRELRRKLATAGIWQSWNLVLIERDKQGRLFATGESVGPNYHLGALHSPDAGMVFEAASGFYGASEACLPGYRICPIVKFRGNYLDIAPETERNSSGKYYFNEFITTGARAGFRRLTRIPLDATEVEKLAVKPRQARLKILV